MHAATPIENTTADRTVLQDGRVVLWTERPDERMGSDPSIRLVGTIDDIEVAFMHLRASDHFVIHCAIRDAANRGIGLGAAMYQAALLRYGSLASVYGRRSEASDRIWFDVGRRGWAHHRPPAADKWRAMGPCGLPPAWHPSMEFLTLAGQTPTRNPIQVRVLEVTEADQNPPGNNPWWPGRRVVLCTPVDLTGYQHEGRFAVARIPHETAVIGDVLSLP